MARPERPLDPSDGPIAAFAGELRKLRADAGSPKYLQMARRTGRSRTALAEAAGGDHLPTWETVEAFVTACGAEPAGWLPRWEQAKEAARSGWPLHPAAEPPLPEPELLPPPEPRRRWPIVPLVAGLAAGVLIGALGAVVLTRKSEPAPMAFATDVHQPAVVGFTRFAAFVDADLATTGPHGTVEIWNSQVSREMREIRTGEERVIALAFDPQDRNLLATAGPSGLVQLWDVSTGRSVLNRQVQAAGGAIVLCFNPILRGLLAIGGAEGVVTLWPTQHPDQATTTIRTGFSQVTALSFDPHGATTLAVGAPEGADIWDAGTGQQVPGIAPMPGPVAALSFDPMTQNTLALATPSVGLGIWDASNGKYVRSMSDAQTVTALAFNPQIRNSLLSGDSKGRIRVWDASSGVRKHQVGVASASISSLAYAADGRSLASGDRRGRVRLWPISDW